MGMSQKALQKKREKKNQSRQKTKSTKSFVIQPTHITYSRWPLHECWIPVELWETGIGHVIVSRKSSLGDIAVSMYLVDVHCLGIKDCFIKLVSPSGYKDMLNHVIASTGQLEPVEASYASTLIHKAKDYAMQIGFKPHPDFTKTQWMLKNIPIDETQQFIFGKDNKPFYVQGPNESQADVKRIMRTLQARLEQDKYDYIVEV
ncbi:MAG: hypothetical protein NTW94_00625 [Legionellales bacterium]|nr:hypothetical protein [Legionellales bacterium]